VGGKMVKLSDVCSVLNAKIISGAEKLQKEFTAIYACDLMSEVLATGSAKGLLITTLTSPQVIRTAEMLDLAGIIFVNGKIPNTCVINLAHEKSIPLLISDYSLFETCGMVYKFIKTAAEG